MIEGKDDDESKTIFGQMSEMLGISEQRLKELEKIILENDTKENTDKIKTFGKLDNSLEAAFCSFVSGFDAGLSLLMSLNASFIPPGSVPHLGENGNA